MTQASLSPDFDPPMRLDASIGMPFARDAASSGAALWLFGLTAATLVGASLLVLGTVALGVVSEAAISGFMAAVALMTGMLGMVAAAYVVTTARRAGFLRPIVRSHPKVGETVPAGMHVVPARPADPSRRLRQQREAERHARNRQASAIRTAEANLQARRAVLPTSAQPRPLAPAGTPVTARTRAVAPSAASWAHAGAQIPTAAHPVAASAHMRLAPPQVNPRSQAARMQVGVASARAAMTAQPPRPRPAVPGSRG